jgi:disulfide bond formation protein DsbB
MDRVSNWLNRNSMYIALLAAWIAMCGSLYFSEVRGYVPCVLCWYQRILMYPLAGIIAVGLLRRDWNLPYYVLPFSLFGLGMSTYHYLLEKTDIFAGAAACRQGVSCTTQWINWFGFVTIPFLALTAFLIITLMAVIALINRQPVGEDEEGDPLRTPWLRVAAPIVAVLAVSAVLFITGAPPAQAVGNTQVGAGTFPVADVTPGPQELVDHAAHGGAAGADVGRGEQLYLESCAACHGIDALGVVNLGNQLAGSDYLNSKTDAELLAMIREGRDLNHPENTTGLVMPPSGGRPDLSDQDLLSIIAFIRAQP